MKLLCGSLFVFLILSTNSILAQTRTGSISGEVLDAQTAEPMFGVTVVVRSAAKSARTDIDGKYVLGGLADGTYDVEFIMQGLETQKRKVNVQNGKARSNVAMGVKKLDTVQVEGRALNDTEASLLKLQKKAPVVSDGISAEMMARTPDSSAGDSARRITGITLVGGRFVFVRGLGERYSNTLLNSVPLPSTEPDKRVVPLDLFPSSLLKNIIISKTFIPEDQAEFSGGTVKIETKDYPDQFFLKVGISTGANKITTGNNFQTYNGGDNFFGTTEGNRTMPDLVRAFPGVPFRSAGQASVGYPNSLITAGSLQFQNQWSPHSEKAPLNKGFNFSTGNTFNVMGGRKLGMIFAITYNHDYQFKQENETLNRAGGLVTGAPVGGNNIFLIPYYRYNQKTYTEGTNWGSVYNTTFEVANGHRLHWKNFFSVSNDKEVWQYGGDNFASTQTIRATKLNYVMRNLYSTQLGGDHRFKVGDRFGKIDWRMSQSEANRNQPDMRDTIYATPVGGLLSIQPNLIEGQLSRSNFYSKTRDVSRFLGGDVEIPFTQWSGLEAKLKLGFTAMERTRSFDAERFFFRQNTSTNTNLLGGQLTPSLYPFTPEAILNPLNRGTQGYYVDESTRPTDTYAARQKLYSKYLQIDTPVVSKLRFIGGVRYENNFQVVTTKNPFDLAATFFDAYNYRGYLNQNQLNWIDPTYRKTTAINQNKNYLPSANFVYALSDNTNIRTAYTETISRPDFREMSAFEFTPILGGAPEKGNPFLKRAYIHNYDVRYEYYPRSEEVIAIGVFKKQISSPIEKVMEIDSQFRYTYTNAKSAQIQGVEFELRKNLDIVSQVLRKWTFGVNTFFIKSEVSFNDWWFYLLNVSTQRPTSLSRPLQGQSPYVYNVNLRYKFDEKGDHSITILFNQFGKRINAVGGLGIPDTYERPVGMLDAVYSFKYFEKLDFKFALRNITDTRIKIVQEDPWRQKETTINSYRLGPTITFSVTYNL